MVVQDTHIRSWYLVDPSRYIHDTRRRLVDKRTTERTEHRMTEQKIKIPFWGCALAAFVVSFFIGFGFVIGQVIGKAIFG
jgi:hypothetical protein